MPPSLRLPDNDSRVRGLRRDVDRLLRRAAAGSGNEAAWVTPTLINSWANAGTPFDDIAYRLSGTTLEFKGHITGGVSGSVAFILAAAYWPTKDLSTCTDVVTTVAPGVAQIYVEAANGEVTVTQIV